jgi:hypothetical protein
MDILRVSKAGGAQSGFNVRTNLAKAIGTLSAGAARIGPEHRS